MSRSLELVLTGRDASLSQILAGGKRNVADFHRKVDDGNKNSIRGNSALTQSFQGLSTAVGGLPGSLTRVAAGMARITDHGPGVKLLAAGVVGLGAAAAVGFGLAITKAAEFDSQMRNVNSLLHLSDAGFQQLEKSVIQMSTRLPQSASTLAEGLYNITSSGYQGADALKILDAAATAASAGLTDTETSGRAITSVLQSYGLQAKDAADVSDTLFQTVNLGVLSFGELAGGLGDVVGIAATAKVDIAQVGSAIATMTLSGQNGAIATNSLQNLLQKTIKPSAALAEEFKKLGYESGAQALESDGLRVVMEKLRVATGGNIEELLKLYPDIQAARGALALMANEGKNYTKVAGQIESADARRGATQRTLNEQMKSFNNQLQLTKNRAEAVAITAGTKLLPIIISLLGGVNDLGSKAGKLASEMGDRLSPAWDDLVSVGHSVVSILDSAGEAVGPLVAGLAALAAVGVVATLTAIAAVLSLVAGLAADHSTMVQILATAYGVRLVAGLIAAQGGLKGILQFRVLLPMWYGMAGAVDKATAAMKLNALAAKALNGALLLAVSYVLVEGIQTFAKFQNAGKETAAAIKEVYDQLGATPDLKAINDAQTSIGKLQQQIKDPGAKSWTDVFGGVKGIVDAQAARKSIDELAAAQLKLSQQQQTMQLNLTGLSTATGMSTGKIQELAKSMGIDLSGSFLTAYNALVQYQNGTTSTAGLQGQLIKAMSDLADAGGDAEAKVKALKAALDALMGAQLGVNEATRNWIGGMADLTKQLESTQGATRKSKGAMDLNTAAGRANSAAIDGQAKALADLVVAQANNGATSATLNHTWDTGVAALRRVMSQAGYSKGAIDKYTTSLGLVPGNVKTVVDAAGADSSAAEVKRLRAEIAALQSKSVTVTATTVNVTRNIVTNQAGQKVVGARYEARGDILTESYAGGGVRMLPKQAMIARNGEHRIEWAENGTGGEAFIPLAKTRRNRSEQILARVADMFGMEVTRMASGGIIKMASGGYVNGRWIGPAGSHPTALQRAREVERQRKARATASAAAAKRQAAARQSGAFSLDLGGATSTALNSADGLGGYSHQLSKSILLTDRWRRELAKIAAVAGDDVAQQLESMGDRGVDLVHKMATGTGHAMITIANQLRSLKTSGATDDFLMSLRGSTKQVADFQSNLLKLINRGQTTLAAKLSEMGVESAGAIAAQAATASGSQLATLTNAVNANNAATDPNLASALKLANLLSAGGGKLGIQGLSTQSGMSLGDVFVLLSQYSTKVFSKLGHAADQVNKDLALIKAGKQPSGHATGALIPGGRTGYYWAEPGSDGESLISHRRTEKSRALWEQTGRILGQQPAARGGTVVTVAPGAVQVRLDFKGSDLTAADAERIAVKATTTAVRDLADKLRGR